MTSASLRPPPPVARPATTFTDAPTGKAVIVEQSWRSYPEWVFNSDTLKRRGCWVWEERGAT